LISSVLAWSSFEARTHRWRYYGDEVPPVGQEVLVKVKTIAEGSEDDCEWIVTATFDGNEWDKLDKWYDKVIAWCPMPGEAE
jgi:hypothetical protein